MPQPRNALNHRIRCERRRLGRFVAFSEILADVTPKPLFDIPPSSGANLSRRGRDPQPSN
jgi:hypothetical protein